MRPGRRGLPGLVLGNAGVRMHIKVRRTGGFAGVDEELASLDTASAPNGRELEDAVREARLFDLPEQVGGVGADSFQYHVTVREGDRSHTVVLVDDGSAEAKPLRRLIEKLAPSA